MTTIKVEKNVPLTAWGANALNTTKRGAPTKYPFATMAVGDSFSVVPKSQKNFQSSVWALAAKQRKLGKTFATRSYKDGSVRVWRTA
jgi:hypothetical protein